MSVLHPDPHPDWSRAPGCEGAPHPINEVCRQCPPITTSIAADEMDYPFPQADLINRLRDKMANGK